jgi:hypothetical protein
MTGPRVSGLFHGSYDVALRWGKAAGREAHVTDKPMQIGDCSFHDGLAWYRRPLCIDLNYA